MSDNARELPLRIMAMLKTVSEHSGQRIRMHAINALLSACAGEFILIGLSVDTIHRGTTTFDRHPTQRPR